jgi:hypothetical protein
MPPAAFTAAQTPSSCELVKADSAQAASILQAWSSSHSSDDSIGTAPAASMLLRGESYHAMLQTEAAAAALQALLLLVSSDVRSCNSM